MPERVDAARLEACAQDLLAEAEAEHVEIWSSDGHEASTRFSNNVITQNIARQDHSVQIRAAYGKRVGAASTNDLTREALTATLRRAEALARSAAEDLEFLPPPGPQTYPTLDTYDAAAASLSPEQRAAAIAETCDLARAKGAECFGSYASSATRHRLWNSAGLTFDHEYTSLLYANTAKGAATTGWAKRHAHGLGAMDTRRAAEIAIDKATRFDAVGTVEPGEYTVVLEPSAFADLLSWVQWTIDAKMNDEGLMPWSPKVGTRVCTDLLTMRSQPGHTMLGGYPAIEDGLAAPSVTWIDGGVLRTLAYSRFWAEKSGVAVTGHPGNFIVEAAAAGHGTKTAEEIVRGVERGILITRFWYMNFVDEMSLTITGMTRDGLFLIENGEIVGALQNMRFNDSPLSFLNKVSEVGKSEVAVGEWDEAMLCPPVRIDGFHFTSGTSF